MGAGWGCAQQRSAQNSGPLLGWKLGSGLGLLGDSLREGLGGPPCFPTLGAVGDRRLVADHRSEQHTPQLFPRGSPGPH